MLCTDEKDLAAMVDIFERTEERFFDVDLVILMMPVANINQPIRKTAPARKN